uniref:Tim44-like domain-containing protein n=1 Tax=Strongyloides stercoralis TaxID=6248 RepID=A0AAF5D5H4_STRER
MAAQGVSKSVPKIIGTFLVYRPVVIAPPFEILRFTSNIGSQFLYKVKIEKNFSKQGLINGANKAIISSAYCIKNEKWDDYSNIACKDLILNLKNEINEKSEKEREMLEKLLETASFEKNIKKTIVISSLFKSHDILNSEENSKVDFHTSFLSYINNPENPKNEYYCNITISRRVSPLGKWKIGKVNFFDNQFALNFI